MDLTIGHGLESTPVTLGAGIVIVRVLLTGVLPGWLTVTVTCAL
jgi:hypothetical protein